ncbi:PcfJ domain-containing protein, partial [Cetobacterium sp.]|uniref:PcfJ domain-containing protein n=1 Tax=Cetobacterium sp. TaxID=2071632 RepID=UPI003F3A29AE
AYYMDFIKEEDYQKLYEFCKEITYFELDIPKDDESLDLIRTVRYKRRKFEVLRLLELFLRKKIKYSKSTQEQQRERGIVSDFINMSIQNNEKISLKRTSIKKIREDHNKLALERRLKYYKVRLKIGKKFDNLKLSKEFILLKTTKEIVKEGIVQNHCVASYIPEINEGKCVIYTVDYNNIKYTLEIGYTSKTGYCLRQIQGYSNREIVPEELIEKIKVQLKENNIKIKSA